MESIFVLLGAVIAAIIGTPALAQESIGYVWRQGRLLSAPLERHLRLRHARVVVHGLIWAMIFLTIIEACALCYVGSLGDVNPMRIAVAGAAFLTALITMNALVTMQWNSWARWRRSPHGGIIRFPRWMTNEAGQVLDKDGNVLQVNGQNVTLNANGEPVANGTVVTAQNDLERIDPHPFSNRPEAVLEGFNPDSLRLGWSLGTVALAFLLNGLALIHLGVMANVRGLIILGLADIIMILGPIVAAGKLGESLAPMGGRIHRITQMLNAAPRAALANLFILCAWVVVFPFAPTMYVVGIVLFTATLTYYVLADRGDGERVKLWLWRAAFVQAAMLVPLSGIVMAWETLPNDPVIGLVKTTLKGWGMAPINAATGQEAYTVPEDWKDIVIPMVIALVLSGGILFVAQKWCMGALRKALRILSAVGLLTVVYHGIQLYMYSKGEKTMGMPQYASLTPPLSPPSVPPADLFVKMDEDNSGYVLLFWTEMNEDETNFVIERRTSRSTFEQIGSASANRPQYVDMTAKEETFYYYRVSAVNAGGASKPSNEATIFVPKKVATQAEIDALTQPAKSPPPPATEEDVDEAPAKASPTRTSKKSRPTAPREEYSEAQKDADFATMDNFLSNY